MRRGFPALADIPYTDSWCGPIDRTRSGLPLFGAFLSDGKTLLLPHQGDDEVSIIDIYYEKNGNVLRETGGKNKPKLEVAA